MIAMIVSEGRNRLDHAQRDAGQARQTGVLYVYNCGIGINKDEAKLRPRFCDMYRLEEETNICLLQRSHI